MSTMGDSQSLKGLHLETRDTALVTVEGCGFSTLEGRKSVLHGTHF